MTMGAMARLHLDHGWPLESVAAQSIDYDFDVVADDGQGRSVAGEIKKTVRKLDDLIDLMTLYGSDTGAAEPAVAKIGNSRKVHMLKNPFARSLNGEIVHIDDVAHETGPYSCAGCGDEMSKVSQSKPYSRKGSDKVIQRRGYFRHRYQDECGTGLETSLHLWAKLIIEEAMTVGLPIHTVKYRELIREFDTVWEFNSVTLEQWQDGIRPDVVLHHPDGHLNVEVRVTHAVDERKAAQLRERSQSCIEIDLSALNFDETPGAELRNAILHHAPRIWIIHQMEEERICVLEDEWMQKAKVAGEKLQAFLGAIPILITDETRAKHEEEIRDLGHEPFIGRNVPGQHWFVAPARNWQHVALKVYLHPIGERDGEYRYDQPPRRMSEDIHVFRNEDLPREIDPSVLQTAGLTVEDYGSHHEAVEAYFRMLCEEPDLEGVHPIGRRIVSPGSEPGAMVMNPDRASYIRRRNEIRNAYKEAGKRRRFGDDEFRTWYASPLSRSGAAPKKICAAGGIGHARLIAHLLAIVNMLDGGWPVDHLLGVEEAWLRDRKAREYNKPLDAGGGPHPYYQDTHRVCASTRMMREKRPVGQILASMATRLHKDTAEATSFLETPNRWIEDVRPIDFVTDIPTLQRCISLMPADPSFSRPRKPSYLRIW